MKQATTHVRFEVCYEVFCLLGYIVVETQPTLLCLPHYFTLFLAFLILLPSRWRRHVLRNTADFQQTTSLYIPGDRTIQTRPPFMGFQANHRFSNIFCVVLFCFGIFRFQSLRKCSALSTGCSHEKRSRALFLPKHTSRKPCCKLRKRSDTFAEENTTIIDFIIVHFDSKRNGIKNREELNCSSSCFLHKFLTVNA
jgi:hypothetical protein